MRPKGNNFKRRTMLVLLLVTAGSVSYISNRIGYFPSIRQHVTKTGRTTESVITGGKLPHEHVYYLKTHKTGSTTMYAILVEYSRSHELMPLLPRDEHINQGGQFKQKQLMLVKNVKKYDMIFSHHVYSPLVMNYLHNDTFRVTSLREPFSNFISAFNYYRYYFHREYLEQVPTVDPITEFLNHPEQYEAAGYVSMTNNRQSMDMGYDLSKGFNNTAYIKQFIKDSDRRFDLVLIMEYFDEGLVLMKRSLHWNTEDILYFVQNVGKHRDTSSQNKTGLEIKRRKLHAKFSQADIMVYNHFLKRFKQRMATEVGLREEVAEFRNILVRFAKYCDTTRGSNEKLTIASGKWNNQFQISRLKCIMLSFDFHKLTSFIKEQQRSLFSSDRE